MLRIQVKLICVFMVFVNLCHSQQYNGLIKNLDLKLEEKIKNREVPSIAYCVTKNGKIIYQNALGLADIKNKIPASINTSYQIASTTKPLTAAGIMILHEKNLLNIDEEAERFMGKLKFGNSFNTGATPSIRNLLNHTSGLGTYFDIYYDDELIAPIGFEEAFKKFGKLHHPPGVISEYSNLGYGLLDYIIVENSDKAYAEFMNKELFIPLGMNNSYVQGFNISDRKIQEAKKYTSDLEELPVVTNNTFGAGNIFASATDLTKFGNFLLGTLKSQASAILSKQSKALLWDYRDDNAIYHYHSGAYYGLGWYVKPNDNGYKVVWHEGGMMGVSSTLKIIPDEKIVISVITNTNNRTVCNYALDELSKIVLPEYKPTPLNEVTEIADYRPIASDTTYLGKWSGTISSEDISIPFSLDFKEDGKVMANYLDYTYKSYFTKNNPLPNKEELLMALTSNNSFIGLFLGELPFNSLRNEFSHLLSVKLLKNQDKLSGTIVALAAANREYYAYPFHVDLSKSK